MDDSNTNSSDQKQIGHAYSWLGEHGRMSYGQLKALAEEGTLESLERLHELADDNNITYDSATEPMLLAEEINNAIETDENTGVE
jgi:hypothetical protein